MAVQQSGTPDLFTKTVLTRLVGLNGPCVGCSDCNGLCEALIEALTVPDLITRSPASAR